MCFTIPVKVLRVNGSTVIIEGGQPIKLGKDLDVKKGEYIQIVGSLGVEKLSAIQGLKIRKLIKSLNN